MANQKKRPSALKKLRISLAKPGKLTMKENYENLSLAKAWLIS